MSLMERRIAKLESSLPSEPEKAALTFLWGSAADDEAVAALQRQSDIEGRPLIVIMIGITVFAIALPRLGMFMTVPILIFIVSAAGDEFHWLGVLISSVVLTIFSYLVFSLGLGLTIPLYPWFMAT